MIYHADSVYLSFVFQTQHVQVLRVSARWDNCKKKVLRVYKYMLDITCSSKIREVRAISLFGEAEFTFSD